MSASDDTRERARGDEGRARHDARRQGGRENAGGGASPSRSVARRLADARAGSRLGALVLAAAGLGVCLRGAVAVVSDPSAPETGIILLSGGLLGLVAGVALARGGPAAARVGLAAFGATAALSAAGLVGVAARGAREGAPVGMLVAALAVSALVLPLIVLETRPSTRSSGCSLGSGNSTT